MDIGQKLYQKQNLDEIKALSDKEKLMLDDEGVSHKYLDPGRPFTAEPGMYPGYSLNNYAEFSGKHGRGEFGTDNAIAGHDPSEILSPKTLMTLFKKDPYDHPSVATHIYRQLGALNRINNPEEYYDENLSRYGFRSKDEDANHYKHIYDKYEKEYIPEQLSELDDKEKERFINIIKMIKGK